MSTSTIRTIRRARNNARHYSGYVFGWFLLPVLVWLAIWAVLHAINSVIGSAF